MIKFENVKMPDKRTAMEHMEDLAANIRFVARGPTMVSDHKGGFTPSTPGYTMAEVIDRTTGDVYARGQGDTEEAAVISAITAARTAEKPLTKAQKADPSFKSMADELEMLRKKIAVLEGSAQAPNGHGATPVLTRAQKAALTRAANKAKKAAAATA